MGRRNEVPKRAAGPDAERSKAASVVPVLPRRRILYVDDNANRLQQAEKVLAPYRDEWELVFAAGGTAALQLMDQAPFDGVVAELQMEEMNGVELLNRVTRRCPKTLRFVGCGTEEQEPLKSCLGRPPYVIPRGFDSKTFQAVVNRAFRMEEWVANDAVKRLMEQLTQLPALPTLYTQVMSELQSPKGSLEFVAKLISRDPVMTAKILHMVNSTFFALPQQITETAEAVMFLGAERIKSMILLSHVFTQFDKSKCPEFKLEQLWMHCMATGAHSMAITMAETHDPRQGEMAFTAGLLHDVGMLLLAANIPTQYSTLLRQAAQREISIRDVEMEIFGASHAEVGACLLGTWGLPLPILEAIALHHCPVKSGDRAFSLLTAVHVANVLDYERRAGKAGTNLFQLDVAYLQRLGLLGRLSSWRERCGCQTKDQDDAGQRAA